jgi:hypothetical protein
VIFERYSRPDTSSKFYRYHAQYTIKISPLTIEGSKSFGYYISGSDFNNKRSSASGNIATKGFCQIFNDDFSVKPISTTYDPANWRKWTEDDYIYEYPSQFPACVGWFHQESVSCFYQKGYIPTTIDSSVNSYGVFSKALVPVSETEYKEDTDGTDGGSTTVRYTRKGTGPNYYYQRQ